MEDMYSESIGLWKHELGKVSHDIFPIEGDNLKVARLMKQAGKNGLDWMYEQFNTLYFDLVTRAPTPFELENGSIRVPVPADLPGQKPGQNHARLKRWIEMNQVKIHKDLLIKFGWTTKEQAEKLEDLDGETLKKLINA